MTKDRAKLDDLLDGGDYPTEAHYVGIYGEAPASPKALSEWRGLIRRYQADRKADKIAAQAADLMGHVNQGDTALVASALVAQHPYLVNELVMALIHAMDKRFGSDGGFHDGRISPALYEVMERFRV